MIRKILRKIAGVLCGITPKTNIIFESAPDFSDNTRAVFDELVKRQYNKKYRFIWLTRRDDSEAPAVENLKRVRYGSRSALLHRMFSKAVISCNGFVSALSKHQFAIYLDHGTPLKDTSRYTKLPKDTYYLSSSADSVEIRSRILGITDASKVVALGFPRNDVFAQQPVDISGYFGSRYNKVIVWYPTFRQHNNGHRYDGGTALPLIHDPEWAKQLNDELARRNVLVVLKPHFAQDVSAIRDLGLSNIRFIDDSFYPAHGITSYQFLNACDAMITDYSSVYYDYLLCDKPIGLVWEDIEQYKNGLGLVENYEFLCKGGEKIYTVDELCGFIDEVASGTDNLKAERGEIRKWAHYSTDGRNTERVVDFIVERAKL